MASERARSYVRFPHGFPSGGLWMSFNWERRRNKTPRARGGGGQQWRPDSSCWSWKRSTWPRKKARNESALTAQTKAQCRCNCPPEPPPASPPGHAMRTAGTA
eukprot:scaffold2172_cov130-Isochrysis_galbana.AAC.6